MDNTAYEHDMRQYNNNTKDAEVGYDITNVEED